MLITALSKPTPKNSKHHSDMLVDSLELTCFLCAHPYDTAARTPTILCSEQHTYCALCIAELFRQRPVGQKCPACRALVCPKAIMPNRSLIRVCELLPQLKGHLEKAEREKREAEGRAREAEKECEQLRKRLGMEEKSRAVSIAELENRLPQLQPAVGKARLSVNTFLARRRMASQKASLAQQQRSLPKGRTLQERSSNVSHDI